MANFRTRDSLTTRPGARAPLPVERAFVIQLRADADPGNGAMSGRIEHVSSGAAALFDSVEQLVAWMQHAIARNASSRHE